MTDQQIHLLHLQRRAGFGCSPSEWAAIKGRSVSNHLARLFAEAQEAQSRKLNTVDIPALIKKRQEMSRMEKAQMIKEGRQMVRKLNADWVSRMANPDESALLEKMCLFWHGHFACTLHNPGLAQIQLQTIRDHALGNFRDLLLAMARDPGMIRFLNNQQNKKQQPNENFARELMELFTIGRGHYTEQDVKAAARAFTGWSSNLRGEFVFRRRWHDFGSKTFMGKTGAFDGTDIIEIILEREETAFFICQKIYRFFVSDQVDENRVRQLARQFYTSGYNIAALMREIFSSDWFYDGQVIGSKIKSPVELLAGTMRILHMKFADYRPVHLIEKALGQVLFDPPNVAGWPGGKSWIDNASLMLRLNLSTFLLLGADANIRIREDFESERKNRLVRKIEATTDLTDLTQVFVNSKDYEALRDFLLPNAAHLQQDFFKGYVDRRSPAEQIKTWTLRMMSLPEYQMS